MNQLLTSPLQETKMLLPHASGSPRPPGLGMRPANACSCRTARYQRGQALTEVLVTLMFVLIPTFAIGWALYAYGQARTTALNGARYAAWERTVWHEKSVSGATAAVRPASEIESLMVERFFAKPDAAIKSTSGSSATNADLPSFYSVHNADKVIDIEKTADTADAGEAARPTLKLKDSGLKTSTVSSLYNSLAGAMNSLGGGGGPKLEEKGLYVAEVNAKLNNIRNVQVFDSLGLDITQRAAVLTDNWGAGSQAHEKAIVKPMVPMSLIGDLLGHFGPFIETLSEVGVMPFKDFKPGCIRGDVVPKEALPPGQPQTKGKCN